MIRRSRLVGIAIAFLLALGLMPVAAQEQEESVLDDPSQLEGIEAGVSRSWYTTMDMSTPPAEGESVVFFAGVAVLEFDSEDNAEAAFGAIRDYFDSSAAAELGIDDADLTLEAFDDFGDNGYLIEAGLADEDETAFFRYIIIHDDEYVYYGGAVSTDAEAAGLANDLVAYVDGQDDDASGLGEFNEDGTSTGGLWDLLPAADDEMIGDLVIEDDKVLYPEQDEEAA